MNKIPEIFRNSVIDIKRLNALQEQKDPKSRYMIAMTPRSGSTYLCDLMSRTGYFGQPHELINQDRVPNILKNAPGRNPDEYIRHVMRDLQTNNGVSGLKTSWFQFENFTGYMNNLSYLSDFKYIYLTRRNLAAQAVSLYKATSSGVFHTDMEHSPEALAKLHDLEYDYASIKYWYDHIVVQEKGWQNYFYENRIYPLCISYEDIEDSILKVLQRIAIYVGVEPNMVYIPIESSTIKKVSDHRNGQWTRRFAIELSLNHQAR
ncbi:MAG: Stf0 family sulfotransferase [Methylovulum sp.]|nr:Stf0 family sulfotransferase [Methylovulum sp.]